MVKGKHRDEVHQLLENQRWANRATRREKREEEERLAHEAAVQPFADLCELIDKTVVRETADTGEHRFHLDQRILNSTAFRTELVTLMTQIFPGFRWSLEDLGEDCCGSQGWKLVCQTRLPSLRFRLLQWLKRS